MIKEFRDFILRGNLVDLAVAVVIGTAFAALVKSFTDNLITPILALIGGKPDLTGLRFDISGTEFFYGAFLTDAIGFLIIAAVIFFFVVKPVNLLMERARSGETEDAAPDPQIVVLEEIRDLLKAQQR